MKFKKTKRDNRGIYTFRFDDGTSVTLHPGEDGVTEADIKLLHSLDDAEVYSNIKTHRPPTYINDRKRWEEAHPGQRYPTNWNLSLDYLADGESDTYSADKDRFITLETCTYMDTDLETEAEMIRRLLGFLTETQRKVYYLVRIMGYTQTEVAKMLGTSIPNINKHLKKALSRIKEQRKCGFPEWS